MYTKVLIIMGIVVYLECRIKSTVIVINGWHHGWYFASGGTSVDSVHSKLLPLLDQLPAPHRSTLDTLLEHLVRVTSLESQNKMSTRNLALLFGPTLLRPPPDDIQ